MNIRHLGLVLLAGLSAMAATAADLENEYVALTFGEKGEIASIKDKASGRELVKKPMPFAEVVLEDGKKQTPMGFEVKVKGEEKVKVKGEGEEKVKVEGQGQQRNLSVLHSSFITHHSSLTWFFPGGGVLELSVTPFEGGWTFTSEKFTVEGAKTVEYMRVTPACDTYKGSYANMFSDDEDGVCIRAYDLGLEMPTPGGWWATYFPVLASKENGFTGHRCGLSAGPKSEIVKMLQGMTLAAGVPYSTCGGAWSLGAPENRESYVFAYYEGTNFDEWMNMLELTGIGTIHFHLWYSSSANYTNINRTKFPKGLEGLKEAADAVHKAGHRFSLHTLSALIAGPNPWTGPVAREGLQSVYRYTALNALTNGVTELLVKERPADDMDTVQTYSSFGNFLRLGGEIIQYSGIRREPPYAFTGVTRGALGSRPADHPAGETAHYLRARYYGLYPDADSDVMDEIAARFATVFNTVQADRVYFDGAEGIGPNYGRVGDYQIATMVNKMYGALDGRGKSVQMGMSCVNKHTWWLRSDTGAVDSGKYALKVFDRNHLVSSARTRKTNLLVPQLGWWIPGKYTDETDYYMSHVAGMDGATSLDGPIRDINKGPLGMHWQHEITILGWYEHFRMAKAFGARALEKYADLDSESRLRQDANGVWQVEDIDCFTHRVSGAASKKWTQEAPHAGTAEPVIHILGGTEPYADPAAISVANGSDAAKMKVTTADKGIVSSVALEKDARLGDCFRFEAVNGTKVQSNAWAMATLDWGEDRKDFSAAKGVGFWVKGDGSGALLDVRQQVTGPYSPAPNDCLVRLDFTGWRYFEFLFSERDAYEYVKHVWPMKPGWTIYSTVFTGKNVGKFELVLTEIPVKNQKEVFLDSNADAAMAKHEGVQVLVSEVRAVGRRSLELSAASLVVNGRTYAIPFASVESGDRILLQNGTWIHRDATGELKEKVKTGDRIAFKQGANRVAFNAQSTDGEPRADVKFLLCGDKYPALKPTAEWPAEWKRHGMFEAMLPVEYCPKKGATELTNLTIRPGERAKVVFQLVGDVKGPWIEYSTVDGFRRVNLPDVSDGKRVVQDGPVLAGVRALRFGCADPDTANVRVEILKRYTDEPAADETPPPPVVKEPTKWERLALRVAAEMKEDDFTDEEIETTCRLLLDGR